MKLTTDNIIAIGDTHLPFEHEHYLAFILRIQREFGCGTVVHIGDLVDNHAIHYHEVCPDGYSPVDEMRIVDTKLIDWFKAFKGQKVHLCRGNHDRLVDRKGKTAGLPSRVFKPFREIWSLPANWIDDFAFTIHGVLFKHGTGLSGVHAHETAVRNNRQSTAIGHLHSVAGVEWFAGENDLVFGLSVGCGINRKIYAFDYGKDFERKPILGCGVITDRGRNAQFVPMIL